MIRAFFKGYNNFEVDSVHQWDLNRTLYIEGLGLDKAPKILFANSKSVTAAQVTSVLESGKVVCPIPNALLTEAYPITAYIKVTEESETRTIEKLKIPVVATKKPADYEYIENVSVIDYQEIMNEIDLKEDKATVASIRSSLESDISKKAAQTDFNTLKSRVDNLASLPSGSTSGDAELTDIRVGADGTQYSSAGEAVRGQVGDLKGDLGKLSSDCVDTFKRVVKTNDNYLDTTFTSYKYYPPNTIIPADAEDGKYMLFEPMPIFKGVTYYYKNVSTNFTNIKYIGQSPKSFHTLGYKEEGNFVAENSGYIYITCHYNSEQQRIFTDNEDVYNGTDSYRNISSDLVVNGLNNSVNVIGKLSDGGFIDSSNGLLNTSNKYYSYSNFIPIVSNKIVVKDVAILCFYNANKEFVSSIPQYYGNLTEIKVPSKNIKFMRCSVNAKLSKTPSVFNCKLDDLISSPYNIESIMNQSELINVLNRMVNVLQNWNVNGYVNRQNGQIVQNRNYFYSDYIYICGYDKIVTKGTVFIAFYDNDLTYFGEPDAYVYNNFTEINIPSNAYYMRISTTNPKVAELYLSALDEYNTNEKNKKVMSITQSDSLKEAINEARKYNGTLLYVGAGTYNLIEDFGEEYFNNLDDSNEKAGIILDNDIHIIFDVRAKVVCNYTGNNNNVKKYFSPFNTCHTALGTRGGFILENLNLECSNVRYAVHDEHVDDDIPYIQKYINCNMKIDNSNNNYWPARQCIGGGLGGYADIEIDNCIFESVDIPVNNPVVSYHNTNRVNDAHSRIIMSRCLIKGNGTVACYGYGQSTIISDFIVNSCSLGSEPVSYAYEGSEDNIKFTLYNNEIRS